MWEFELIYHIQYEHCAFCIPFITCPLNERGLIYYLFVNAFKTCFYRMKIDNLINVAQLFLAIAAIVNF